MQAVTVTVQQRVEKRVVPEALLDVRPASGPDHLNLVIYQDDENQGSTYYENGRAFGQVIKDHLCQAFRRGLAEVLEL